MRSKKARQLTAAEMRALASAGLVVTRYTPDGERAEIRQLAPESDKWKRSFAMMFADDTPVSEGDE